ncbi:MAG: ClpXP protease specificity-enhancing factor [Gammaproteobacteria bacterium]|nr:ClpXP protease specificity-enhancing factor [Gammaproteobacteria bacterium]
MLSNKPYLIRAFNEWIVDCKCTPLLVVDATYPRCNVPQEYIENGEIILNISPDAIRDLRITNSLVEFKASFSGIAHLISVPVRAVLAIYAEENGQGMYFDMDVEESSEEAWEETSISPQAQSNSLDMKRKSHLTLVE